MTDNAKKSILSGRNARVYLHYIICFLIMFGFGQLPPFAPLTPLGMQVLGIFLGAVYGWSFTDMVIPSMIGIVSLVFLEGNTIPSIIANGLGTQIVWFMIFLMIFTNVIEEEGLAKYFANWIMSRKALSGHPWLLTFAFLFTAYFLGSVNVFASMFILWGILYGICTMVGYKPYDAYPTIMIIGITLFAILGLVLMPYSVNALVILSTFEKITGVAISFASYIAYMIPLVCLLMPVFIFLARFVFRVDVTLLKNADSSAISNNEPLNTTQKIICVALLATIILLLAPSMLPKTWLFTQFLNKIGMFGTMCFIMAPLMILRVNGQPILSFEKMIARGLPWGAVLVTAFVLPLSPLLTAEETGMQALFMNIIAPLNVLPPFILLMLVFLITTVITNFANNTATALIVMPIILGYSSQAGVELPALVVMLICCTHLAIMTPAACPMAGVMFGNTGWIKGKDIYKYAPIIVVCCFIVLFIAGYFWGKVIF